MFTYEAATSRGTDSYSLCQTWNTFICDAFNTQCAKLTWEWINFSQKSYTLKVPTSIQNVDCGIYKTQQFPRSPFSSQFRLKRVLHCKLAISLQTTLPIQTLPWNFQISSVERPEKQKHVQGGWGVTEIKTLCLMEVTSKSSLYKRSLVESPSCQNPGM